MSGRGGIYKGPNGEKLYGDGREVKAEPSPAPQDKRVIEVAPQGEIPNPMEVRKALWLGHGHSGMYGDDGEMQCGMCRVWDYRRAPFLQIVAQVHELMLESLRSAIEERDRARDALREILEIGKRDMSNPKYDFYFENARAALKPVSDRQPEGETK